MDVTERRVRHLANHLAPAATAASNSHVVIASLPKGPLGCDNFDLRECDMPDLSTLRDGEVLVKLAAFTIGAGQRAGLQGSASYAGAAQTEATMTGTGIGRVEASKDPKFSPGDTVMGATGWAQYAAVAGNTVRKVAAVLKRCAG
jgi:putative cofactor-binding repeat protein